MQALRNALRSLKDYNQREASVQQISRFIIHFLPLSFAAHLKSTSSHKHTQTDVYFMTYVHTKCEYVWIRICSVQVNTSGRCKFFFFFFLCSPWMTLAYSFAFTKMQIYVTIKLIQGKKKSSREMQFLRVQREFNVTLVTYFIDVCHSKWYL